MHLRCRQPRRANAQARTCLMNDCHTLANNSTCTHMLHTMLFNWTHALSRNTACTYLPDTMNLGARTFPQLPSAYTHLPKPPLSACTCLMLWSGTCLHALAFSQVVRCSSLAGNLTALWNQMKTCQSVPMGTSRRPGTPPEELLPIITSQRKTGWMLSTRRRLQLCTLIPYGQPQSRSIEDFWAWGKMEDVAP